MSTKLEKKPDAAVVVATVRALKYQAEKSTDHLKEENLDSLKEGFANLDRHMNNVRSYQIPVLVVINKFPTDTEAELDLLKSMIEAQGFPVEIVTAHDDGSKGAKAAAEKIVELADNSDYELVSSYNEDDDLVTKIEKVAKRIYHAADVEYSDKAKRDLEKLQKLGKDRLPVIIAKTQYSFSDNAKELGAPTDFTLHVKGLSLRNGAGFVVVSTGHILDMPGLPKHPAALDIDVDEEICRMKTIKFIGLVIAALIAAADQGLKYYIATNYKVGEVHDVMPGLFSLTYVKNNGAAWNVLSGQMWLFYVISLIAIGVILYFYFNKKYSHWMFKTGLIFTLGGIIGNLIDRLHLKYVIDMIQLDFVQFNIFNLADSAITVGVVLIFCYLLFIERED